MNRLRLLRSAFAAAVVAVAACSDDEGPSAPAAPRAAVPDALFVAAPPEGAREVKDVIENAKAGETVVVRGKLRDLDPGRALLKLTDYAFKSCDERPDDQCPTPWDYCCEDSTELNRGTVLVEVREGDRLLKGTLEGVHGLARLKHLVVRGTAERDDAGNVTVVADALHVR